MIRTRLTLWNGIVLALVLALLGAIVYASTRATLYGAIDADLESRLGFLERNWNRLEGMPPPGERGPRGPRGPFGRGPGPGPHPPGPPFGEPERGVSPEENRRIELDRLLSRPRVIRTDGTGHMFPSDQAWDKGAMQRSFRGERVFSVSEVADQRVRVLSVPLVLEGRIVAVAQAARSLAGTDELMGRLARTLLALLPLALVVTSLTGVYLTRHALKPVQEIASLAGTIEATNLGGRLPVQGRDEFASLSIVFNTMLDRLESSFRRLESANESQRRFIADASHELKTPLTAIKTRVGVATRGTHPPERYREHLAAIGVSADAMAAIVQDLLLLAKTDEGRMALNRTSVPLLLVAEEAASVVRGPDKAPIEVDVPPELDVCVDQSLFTRALVNLLTNAVRHTPRDGLVRIQAAERNGSVTIRVSDTGEGIPPEHIPRVFERFHRARRALERASSKIPLANHVTFLTKDKIRQYPECSTPNARLLKHKGVLSFVA